MANERIEAVYAAIRELTFQEMVDVGARLCDIQSAIGGDLDAPLDWADLLNSVAAIEDTPNAN